jgi:hypothetical protein
MAIAAHPVQHHPGQLHLGIERAVTVDDGQHRSRQAATINHQQHRQMEQAGNVGRAGHI